MTMHCPTCDKMIESVEGKCPNCGGNRLYQSKLNRHLDPAPLIIPADAVAIPIAIGRPTDAINPSHYRQGKIEVIEVIRDWKLGFCLGNVVKYVARAGKKDPTKVVEDLRKAIRYLEMCIEGINNHLEEENWHDNCN